MSTICTGFPSQSQKILDKTLNWQQRMCVFFPRNSESVAVTQIVFQEICAWQLPVWERQKVSEVLWGQLANAWFICSPGVWQIRGCCSQDRHTAMQWDRVLQDLGWAVSEYRWTGGMLSHHVDTTMYRCHHQYFPEDDSIVLSPVAFDNLSSKGGLQTVQV